MWDPGLLPEEHLWRNWLWSRVLRAWLSMAASAWSREISSYHKIQSSDREIQVQPWILNTTVSKASNYHRWVYPSLKWTPPKQEEKTQIQKTPKLKTKTQLGVLFFFLEPPCVLNAKSTQSLHFSFNGISTSWWWWRCTLADSDVVGALSKCVSYENLYLDWAVPKFLLWSVGKMIAVRDVSRMNLVSWTNGVQWSLVTSRELTRS